MRAAWRTMEKLMEDQEKNEAIQGEPNSAGFQNLKLPSNFRSPIFKNIQKAIIPILDQAMNINAFNKLK